MVEEEVDGWSVLVKFRVCPEGRSAGRMTRTGLARTPDETL